MIWKQVAVLASPALLAAGAAASDRSIVGDPSLREFLKSVEEGGRRS